MASVRGWESKQAHGGRGSEQANTHARGGHRVRRAGKKKVGNNMVGVPTRVNKKEIKECQVFGIE